MSKSFGANAEVLPLRLFMHRIRKECDECKKHGCPPPVYEIIMGESGDILVRIDSAPDAIVNAAIGEQITGSTNEYVGTAP